MQPLGTDGAHCALAATARITGRPGNSSVARLSVAPLSPALLFLRPTPAAMELATTMAAAAANASVDEATALTRAALTPVLGGGEGPTGGQLRAALLPQAAFLHADALFLAPHPSARLRAGSGVAAVHAGGAGDGPAATLQRLVALADYARGKPAALEALAAVAGRMAHDSGAATAVAGASHRHAHHPPRKLWGAWTAPVLAA